MSYPPHCHPDEATNKSIFDSNVPRITNLGTNSMPVDNTLSRHFNSSELSGTKIFRALESNEMMLCSFCNVKIFPR
jgi:hypothetical protein